MSVIDKSRLLLFVGGTVPVEGASAGDVAALAGEVAGLSGEVADKADIANTAKSFNTRADAVASGQAALPAALGLIFVDEGDYYTVRGPNQTDDDPLFATAPHWGVRDRIPTQAVVDALQDILDEALDAETQAREAALNNRIEVSSDPGRPILEVRDTTTGWSGFTVGRDGQMQTDRVSIEGDVHIPEGAGLDLAFEDSAFGLVDAKTGWWVFRVDDEGAQFSRVLAPGFDSDTAGTIQTVFTAADVAAVDGRALGLASVRRSEVRSGFQRPTARYNIILVYGQSLANGKESAPTLTRTPPLPGVLMLGDSVRPHPQHAAYTVIGDPDFKPAVAVMQNNTTGVIIPHASEAGQSYPSPFNGESPAVAAAYTFRRMWLDHYGLVDDPAHEIVVMVPGVGGTPLADLSPGANPDLFNRVTDGFSKVAAAADGADVRLIGTIWLGGEADYDLNTPLEEYRDDLVALRDAIQSAAEAQFGQADPAWFLTYQTGTQAWAKNTLAVGEAQRQVVEGDPLIGMFAPSFPVTNQPDGHLDANGSRWLGCWAGRALYQAVIRGQRPRALMPIEALYRGREVLLSFDVPSPPLSFRDYWEQHTPTDVPNAGLYVQSGGVQNPIVSVDVVGQATVKIVCSFDVTAGTVVECGRLTGALGASTLADSDPALAMFSYGFDPASGQPPSENIPELVGHPYPLNNFAIAFRVVAQEG